MINLHNRRPNSKSRQLFTKNLRTWLLCAACASPFAAVAAQGATSYVYVESNIGQTGNQNSVLAFQNDGAGNLTAVAGSPFLTAGTGVYDPGGSNSEFEADQEVIATPDGAFLFAVNGHSNSIAAFDINSDGTLTTVAGSPFASGGLDPVSLGISVYSGPDTMVCVNKNEDTGQDIDNNLPNYTTFSVGADGALTMNPGSTFNLGANSSPAQALMSTKDHLFFGIEFRTSRLASYSLSDAGIVTEVGSQAPPKGSGGLFLGGAVNSKKKTIYVGFPAGNRVGVFHYNSTGNLAFTRIVPNNGRLPCWTTLNASGTLLYVSETGSGTVSSYTLSNFMRPIRHQQLNLTGTGESPTNVTLDPTEQFLYVVSGTNLHVINIDAGGNMSETTAPTILPVTAGETPLGLAVVRK